MPPRFFRWPTARDHVETALEEIASHFEYNQTAPGFLHSCAGDMRTRFQAHRRCGRFMVEAEPVVFVGAVDLRLPQDRPSHAAPAGSSGRMTRRYGGSLSALRCPWDLLTHRILVLGGFKRAPPALL
jgi:hypothetical protein